MAPCHFKKPHRQRYASTIRKTYPELPFGSTNLSLLRKTLTRLTPQGAVLSPFLWDIFLDILLDTQDKFGSDHKGAILTLSLKGKQIHPAESKDWLKSVDKQLSVSGSLPRINIALEVQNFGKIEQVNKIKFLGVFFDDKLVN